MNYLEILDQVKRHIEDAFNSKLDNKLVYHNFSHTEHVVKHAEELASYYKLDEKAFFVVLSASWFHDLGYLDKWEEHEQRGAEAAAAFLAERGVDEETIMAVRGCILATKMPQSPKGLLEQIVCDSDLYHLGSDDFKDRNRLMRKETENLLGKDVSKDTWRLGTIKLMESHHYHTDYCTNLLEKRKRKNLESLKAKVQENESFKVQGSEPLKANVHGNLTDLTGKAVSEEVEHKREKKEKNSRPERGIETMFRITSGNHQRLSDMADNKAHIMISTNSIILSVILSILLRRLEDNPYLIIPTMLLLIVCVTTMVFSILATRPFIPAGTFTLQDIENKRTNLLFFGNFYRMGLAEYDAGIQKMMDDSDFLYGSLIRDIYGQGVVLGRKYRLLRIAYNVFMYGIVASVIAFIISIVVSM
ncbi:MAG: phosphohydrolase [Pedobacter sp.]|nr:phosphohydrolase [Pedobacter sp.]